MAAHTTLLWVGPPLLQLGLQRLGSLRNTRVGSADEGARLGLSVRLPRLCRLTDPAPRSLGGAWPAHQAWVSRLAQSARHPRRSISHSADSSRSRLPGARRGVCSLGGSGGDGRSTECQGAEAQSHCLRHLAALTRIFPLQPEGALAADPPLFPHRAPLSNGPGCAT